MLKKNELERAIELTELELYKLKRQLSDIQLFESNAVIGFSNDSRINFKLYINPIEISICLLKVDLNGVETFVIDPEIRIYDINGNDLSTKVIELGINLSANDSIELLNLLPKLASLSIANDGVIEYE